MSNDKLSKLVKKLTTIKINKNWTLKLGVSDDIRKKPKKLE